MIKVGVGTVRSKTERDKTHLLLTKFKILYSMHLNGQGTVFAVLVAGGNKWLNATCVANLPAGAEQVFGLVRSVETLVIRQEQSNPQVQFQKGKSKMRSGLCKIIS